MKQNKVFDLFVVAYLIKLSGQNYHSREKCTHGEHDKCVELDGEGACCAQLKVLEVPWAKFSDEKVGETYERCYNFEAVYDAKETNGEYTDHQDGGSGNTYQFSCSDKTTTIGGHSNALFSAISILSVSTISLIW